MAASAGFSTSSTSCSGVYELSIKLICYRWSEGPIDSIAALNFCFWRSYFASLCFNINSSFRAFDLGLRDETTLTAAISGCSTYGFEASFLLRNSSKTASSSFYGL